MTAKTEKKRDGRKKAGGAKNAKTSRKNGFLEPDGSLGNLYSDRHFLDPRLIQGTATARRGSTESGE